MTQATHTPGPWLLSRNPVASLGYMIGAPVSPALSPESARHIGNVYSEANARLIAAAPELLAALDELLGDVELMNEPYRNEAICERARAAIVKARGE